MVRKGEKELGDRTAPKRKLRKPGVLSGRIIMDLGMKSLGDSTQVGIERLSKTQIRAVKM